MRGATSSQICSRSTSSSMPSVVAAPHRTIHSMHKPCMAASHRTSSSSMAGTVAAHSTTTTSLQSRLAGRRRIVQAQANLFSNLFGGGDSKDKPPAPEKRIATPEIFLMQESSSAPEFPPYTVVKRGPVYDLR
jgi:hypothetical protein